MEPLLGTDPRQVGGYRLLGRLGSGGMGEVFLGESPGRRKVAVKLVRPEHAGDTEFRARFAREVEAAKRVGGFHTAQVVDADPAGDPPWLVTAYIPGPSLLAAVERGGPFDPEAVRMLGAALAEGVAAIHGCGLVHRDLKPANIILADDGPRIIDFGVARTPGASDLTSSGIIIGTVSYMSPEQVRGERVDARSDIFSLGGVLAFAATGRSPFDAPTMPAIIHRISSEPPSLDGVADPLRRIIAACLAKDPADRPTLATLTAHLNGAVPEPTYAPPAAPAPLAGQPAVPLAPVPPVTPPVVPPPPPAAAPQPIYPERTGVPPQTPPPRHSPRHEGGPSRNRGFTAGMAVGAVVIVAAAGFLVYRLTTGGEHRKQPPSSVQSKNGTAGTPGATARPDGGIPVHYLGRWKGTLRSTTGLEPTQSATLTITRGGVGAVVGHASYPVSGCTYTFHLVSGREAKVTLHETVDTGPCVTEYVVLTPAVGQAGLTDTVYDGSPADGGISSFTGHLTRAAGSLPLSLPLEVAQDGQHAAVVAAARLQVQLAED